MAKLSAVEFFRQVRIEGRKVTWPTRAETRTGAILVIILVMLAMLLFFMVDRTLQFAVGEILRLGR